LTLQGGRSVCKPFPFRPSNRCFRAFAIRHFPVRPPERELVTITVEVFLGYVVKCPVDTAFEKGEKWLNVANAAFTLLQSISIRIYAVIGVLRYTIVGTGEGSNKWARFCSRPFSRPKS